MDFQKYVYLCKQIHILNSDNTIISTTMTKIDEFVVIIKAFWVELYLD